MNKYMPFLFAFASAAVLAGCSQSPSASQAKEAVVKLYEQNNMPVESLTDFNLSDCKKASDKDGYQCNTKAKITTKVLGHEVPMPIDGNFRYVQADGHWRIVN